MKIQWNYVHKLAVIIIFCSVIGLLVSVKYPLPSLWYSTSVNYHAAADFCSVLFWRFLVLIFSVQGICVGLILWTIGSLIQKTKK